MTSHVPTLVITFKTITLILGGIITYLAFKAYRRTRIAGLQFLTVGFGVVTFGALLAGIIDLVLQVSRPMALIVQSALTMLGFLIITYSLYATRQAS